MALEKITRIAGRAVHVPGNDIDTDRIIPARFMKCVTFDGLGEYLFYDMRRNADGSEKPGFVLNQPAWRNARILVADWNFGCGSSREHAVYCLHDYGFRAVIAPSFGDIFFGNAFKNGFLPVVLPADAVADLRRQITEQPGARIAIDLARQTVTAPSGAVHRFDIDPFRKQCLLQGVDEIAFTLGHGAAIAAFEQRQAAEVSWL